AVELALAPGQHALVLRGGAQGGEVVGHAAAGGGVGALVVVDHDDQRQVTVLGDVVQGLPHHAAGQGAVPDHRDGVTVGLAAQLAAAGDADRPGQRGGGVGVLDDVVVGLGPAGVAREPA